MILEVRFNLGHSTIISVYDLLLESKLLEDLYVNM